MICIVYDISLQFYTERVTFILSHYFTADYSVIYMELSMTRSRRSFIINGFFFLSKNQLLLGLLQYSTTQRRNQDRKNGRAAGAPPPSITNGNLKKYRFCRHVDIKGFT